MNIDFAKSGGLVPAIIQDDCTGRVLMLGYMNEEALRKTQQEGRVTFYSRSKQRLWTKGETSGHFLLTKSVEVDCDEDTLLVRVDPQGPVCHTGESTCFGDAGGQGFLHRLDHLIETRKSQPSQDSYTSRLLSKGINKVAQKVGEEAVELVIEAMGERDDLFLSEAADLVFHLLVLIKAKGLRLEQVERELRRRNEAS